MLRSSSGSFVSPSEKYTGVPHASAGTAQLPLRDVRRRKEHDSRIVRPKRKHLGTHIEIGADGPLRYETHFRLPVSRPDVM